MPLGWSKDGANFVNKVLSQNNIDDPKEALLSTGNRRRLKLNQGRSMVQGIPLATA